MYLGTDDFAVFNEDLLQVGGSGGGAEIGNPQIFLLAAGLFRLGVTNALVRLAAIARAGGERIADRRIRRGMRRVSAFYIIASQFISPWNELQATHDEMMEIVSLDQCYPTTTFKRKLRLFIFQTMENFIHVYIRVFFCSKHLPSHDKRFHIDPFSDSSLHI